MLVLLVRFTFVAGVEWHTPGQATQLMNELYQSIIGIVVPPIIIPIN